MKRIIIITALLALNLNLSSVAAFAAGGGFCRGVNRDAPVCQE